MINKTFSIIISILLLFYCMSCDDLVNSYQSADLNNAQDVINGNNNENGEDNATQAPKLLNLTISRAALFPVFSPDTLTYTTEVSYETNYITVTPTVAGAGATVKVNGASVVSATASAPVQLDMGTNEIDVTVTSADNAFTKTYTVLVKRGLNIVTISTIRGLRAPKYGQTPVTVIDETEQFTGTVTWSPDHYIPAANTVYTAVISLTPKTGYTFNGIPSNVFSVEGAVSAGNSANAGIVTAMFDEPNSDANLASLDFTKGILQPAFDPGRVSYLNAPVPFSDRANPTYNDTQSVSLTATAAQSDSTITVNGVEVVSGTVFTMNNLSVGANTATIVVTAENGITTRTYTVEVYRAIPVFKTGAGAISGYTLNPNEDGATQHGVSWPSPRFTADGPDSIRDEMTGLVWLKNPDSTTRTWSNAITYCEGLSNSYSDWRMPNVRELRSLVHHGQSSPVTWLNSQGFTNFKVSHYWSSTTSSNTSSALMLRMRFGNILHGDKSGDQLFVLPVRSSTP
ncbi:MAG: cadherin-like beta sandwich domain-containing protein [Spirochaetes bacterium]|nr:cadherin-like beta sandwich domain-containing protein [Spirochaetota bacterium]MBN2770328.1 cadherin-like beta sandwich domain-containing protein [Spirochaetota bacterium]